MLLEENTELSLQLWSSNNFLEKTQKVLTIKEKH